MELFIGLIFLCTIIYLLNSYFFNHWKRLNIPQLEPSFPLGNFSGISSLSMSEVITNLYEKSKNHRFIGFYTLHKPSILINDPVLIQHVMIKDFSIFHDRPMPECEERDALSSHLFNLSGERWRDVRAKFTPAFSSGKLKRMFSVMKDVGDVLTNFLEKKCKEGENIFDARDIFSRYTIYNISSIAFGVDNDTINEPNHIFRQMSLKIFELSIMQRLRFTFMFLQPKLYNILKFRVVSRSVEDFIRSLVSQTIEYREKNNVKRNDFMDLMIQLKNFGFLTKEDNEENDDNNTKEKKPKLTENELLAQAFIFIAAGYETSASTMSLCLFELCRNPEKLKKAQEDVDRILKAHGGELSYESLNEMKYLQCCIDETLRIYPILGLLFRTASKDYNIPDSDIVLEKGTSVFISVMGVQRDPAIFENPLEFKPERFLHSSVGNGNSEGLFYLPFGAGGRSCIGDRLGKIQTKLGLAVILNKFNCELVDKKLMGKKLSFHTGVPTLNPIDKLNIKFEKRF